MTPARPALAADALRAANNAALACPRWRSAPLKRTVRRQVELLQHSSHAANSRGGRTC